MAELPRSLPEFEARFPDEAACARWLLEKRWPDGFRCPACGHDKGWELGRERLIPTALVADRFGPLAAGDRGEPVGHRHEPVPRLAAGRDDRVVVGPDAQAELVLAQVLPHVLDRVQLGAVARQR